VSNDLPPMPAAVPEQERTWAVLAHLTAFLTAWFAFGFIGPLVILLVRGDRSPFVRYHAVEAVNFNLSVLIYAAISGLLAFVLIGIPMLIVLGLIYLVTVITGASRASAGRQYRYPITIRFVR
jgi:uncharacterized Tic20 family protein